nr:MAG TPA: hypothetical protein [Caudoviricetes sp.]
MDDYHSENQRKTSVQFLYTLVQSIVRLVLILF